MFEPKWIRLVSFHSRAQQRDSNQGLGSTSTATPEAGDNEYDAYRKRMMLAYRFRPNPMVIQFSSIHHQIPKAVQIDRHNQSSFQNNPRRAYYWLKMQPILHFRIRPFRSALECVAAEFSTSRENMNKTIVCCFSSLVHGPYMNDKQIKFMQTTLKYNRVINYRRNKVKEESFICDGNFM